MKINGVWIGLWLLVLSVGFVFLIRYELNPGQSAVTGRVWPAESKIPWDRSLPHLVMFLHPRCSCSQASMGELERLMPDIQNKAQVTLVFNIPKGIYEGWAKKGLWEHSLRNHPFASLNIKFILDYDEIETERFGAKTSGQVLFYDRNGSLVYNGGITPARGHMGSNPGSQWLISWLNGQKPQEGKMTTERVFGCALHHEDKVTEQSQEKIK